MRRQSRRKCGTVFLIVLAVVLLVLFFPVKQLTFLTVRCDQAKLNRIVETLQSNTQSEQDVKYSFYEVCYYPEADMVEFNGLGSGLGSATSYSGFYYSGDGVPKGYQGTDVTFAQEGNGWVWQEENGDNREETEQITGNWYWFEIQF